MATRDEATIHALAQLRRALILDGYLQDDGAEEGAIIAITPNYSGMVAVGAEPENKIIVKMEDEFDDESVEIAPGVRASKGPVLPKRTETTITAIVVKAPAGRDDGNYALFVNRDAERRS